MPTMGDEVLLQLDGREVRITNPDKPFFPEAGLSKMDLVRYYLSVADGAIRGVAGRPMILKRYPNGVDGEFFYQKRTPKPRPEWIETCVVHFPSGRSADLVVVRDRAQLAWVVNLGCLDLNPWPVRAEDPDHPDELRVDLDPTPDVPWAAVRDVAMECGRVLDEHALIGFPKTSGSRGIHIDVRIEARWSFTMVRKAVLALAREVERRMPGIATSAWWKEERVGVFIDYNQNARDRTVASAYSIRSLPDARVSTPLAWEEVPYVDPAAFTVRTVPDRFARIGDPAAPIDDHAGSLEQLLDLAARDEAGGLGDAPWPPHFPKGGPRTPAGPSQQGSRMARLGGLPASRRPLPLRRQSGELAARARSSAEKSGSGSSGGLTRCQATERAICGRGSAWTQPRTSRALVTS